MGSAGTICCKIFAKSSYAPLGLSPSPDSVESGGLVLLLVVVELVLTVASFSRELISSILVGCTCL